ncbi:MAG: hypothetical protein JWQ20_753 [Conexibacter sp.]|nr:hypothetical protein [Conexibacter sp.]
MFCAGPSDRLHSLANTCSPPPQIPGRPSAPCVRPSGVPPTWSSPSPRSLTSCRRATTPTTSRGAILIAIRWSRPHAPGAPARCPRERSPARRQWPSARGIVAPHSCGDPQTPELGGRAGGAMKQTASGPPFGGPRRVTGALQRRSASTPSTHWDPYVHAQRSARRGTNESPLAGFIRPSMRAVRTERRGEGFPASGMERAKRLTTTSRPRRDGSCDIKPAASYSPGPLRAKYHRR